MIRKVLLFIMAAAFPLLAALGSGLFFRCGAGITGLGGSDLYLLTSEMRYREADLVTMMVEKDEFSSSRGLVRPTFVVGWEQSLNMFMSVQGGAGLLFTGLSWKKSEVTDQFNNVDHVIDNDAALNLMYCTIPLDVRLMLPLNSGGFTCSFGPRFGLLTRAQFDNRARSFKENQYSLFKPYSIGLGGSFGGEIRLKKADLIVELHLDGGATNVSKDESLQLRYVCLALETGIRFTRKRLEKPSWWRL
jgi:hypothetical protein